MRAPWVRAAGSGRLARGPGAGLAPAAAGRRERIRRRHLTDIHRQESRRPGCSRAGDPVLPGASPGETRRLCRGAADGLPTPDARRAGACGSPSPRSPYPGGDRESRLTPLGRLVDSRSPKNLVETRSSETPVRIPPTSRTRFQPPPASPGSEGVSGSSRPFGGKGAHPPVGEGAFPQRDGSGDSVRRGHRSAFAESRARGLRALQRRSGRGCAARGTGIARLSNGTPIGPPAGDAPANEERAR